MNRDQSSRHLVDPALAPMLDALPPINLSAETLAAFRARPFPAAELSAEARSVERINRRIAGPAGAPEVAIALFRPPALERPGPAILHIHGGGYVTGSVDSVDVRQRELCAALNRPIVSVDYRLAPETPFPGPLEDCYAALAWMCGHGGEHGISADGIVLKGESAGGGLAAALALLARDRGEFAPIHQHLTYPMLDDRTGSTRTPAPFAGEFVWTAADNRFGWSALLGREPGSADVSPYAAPARATDLSGLAPAFISCGALDLFAAECLDYAGRLTAAGVPTELHLFPGGFHGFDLAPMAEIAAAARDASLAALRRAMQLPNEAPPT